MSDCKACQALTDERDDLAEQLSEMGRQRDLAIQQAIDEETKHRKWTDDRERLAKDLAAAREELATMTADRDAHWANFCERSGDFKNWQAARADLAKVTAELDVFATADEQRRAAIERFVEERDEARAELAKVTAERDLANRRLISESAMHEKALEATRARCAMLTGALVRAKDGLVLRSCICGHGGVRRIDPEAGPEQMCSVCDEIEDLDTALAAPDAGVAEWLAGVKAEARLAGAQAVLPTLSDEASRALAAHDAQVEAKALARAAKWMNDNGYIVPQPDDTEEDAGKVMLRDLAGKDGTTP